MQRNEKKNLGDFFPKIGYPSNYWWLRMRISEKLVTAATIGGCACAFQKMLTKKLKKILFAQNASFTPESKEMRKKNLGIFSQKFDVTSASSRDVGDMTLLRVENKRRTSCDVPHDATIAK